MEGPNKTNAQKLSPPMARSPACVSAFLSGSAFPHSRGRWQLPATPQRSKMSGSLLCRRDCTEDGHPGNRHLCSPSCCLACQGEQDILPVYCVCRIPGSPVYERQQGDAMDAHPSSAIKGRRVYRWLTGIPLPRRTRTRSWSAQVHSSRMPGAVMTPLDAKVFSMLSRVTRAPAGQERAIAWISERQTGQRRILIPLAPRPLSDPAPFSLIPPTPTFSVRLLLHTAHIHNPPALQAGQNRTPGLCPPDAQTTCHPYRQGRETRWTKRELPRTGPDDQTDTRTPGAFARAHSTARSVPGRAHPSQPAGSAVISSLSRFATLSSGGQHPASSSRSICVPVQEGLPAFPGSRDEWPFVHLWHTATRASWKANTRNRRPNIRYLTGRRRASPACSVDARLSGKCLPAYTNAPYGARQHTQTNRRARGRYSPISDYAAQMQHARGCLLRRTHHVPRQVQDSTPVHSHPFLIEYSLFLKKEMS